MTEMTEAMPATTSEETDLVAAVQQVLAASSDPLTLPKLRSQLPMRFRTMVLDELAEVLRRQVAAGVVIQYPKYRSQHDRFWDRPMPVHVACLLRSTLEAGPLALSELRRKLPAYAGQQLEEVLNEQLAQGLIHRHPRAGKRGGERFGVERPEAKQYLQSELRGVFGRLAQLGFTETQLREGALELLHEEEWSLLPTEEPGESVAEEGSAAAAQEIPLAHSTQPPMQEPASTAL